jgi:DNA polymerase-3 subunit delta'
MQFKEIIGQEAIKKHLIDTVNQNRVSHAQLFLGPEGCGSLALAIAYAQYISCTDRQADDSCAQCASCKKYQKLIHPDLHFSYPFFAKDKDDISINYIADWRKAFLNNYYLGLDEWRSKLNVDNKQFNINIAESHSIISRLSLKPFESEYKIMIMWLPEFLEKSGNALLKIIEEPAPKTVFLLVTQNQEHLLNTIISRTQIVKIPKLKNEDVIDFLMKEKSAEIEKAQQIAYLSNGNLHTAQVFLTHEENNYHEIFVNWLRSCLQNKGLEIINQAEELAKLGRENQKNFFRYGINLMRESVLYLAGIPVLIHLPEKEMDFISKFSKVLDLGKAECIASEFEIAHYHIERNANPKILFLDVSLMLVKLLKFNSFPTGTQHILL